MLLRLVMILVVATMIAGAARASETKHGAASSEEETEGSTFFELPSISVSVIRDARVRGIFTVSMGLEVDSLDMRLRVRKMIPRLSHEYHRVMAHFAAARLQMGKAINLDLLERLFQKATDRVLGADQARIMVTNALASRP